MSFYRRYLINFSKNTGFGNNLPIPWIRFCHSIVIIEWSTDYKWKLNPHLHKIRVLFWCLTSRPQRPYYQTDIYTYLWLAISNEEVERTSKLFTSLKLNSKKFPRKSRCLHQAIHSGQNDSDPHISWKNIAKKMCMCALEAAEEDFLIKFSESSRSQDRGSLFPVFETIIISFRYTHLYLLLFKKEQKILFKINFFFLFFLSFLHFKVWNYWEKRAFA